MVMDSNSSGSIQSSSGGDDEYDSRAAKISTFLQQPRNPHSSSSSMFDPFSNFFDPLPPRSHQINLDTVWPRNPKSDQNPIEKLAGFLPQIQTQPLITDTQLQIPEKNNDNRNEVVKNNNGVRNPRKRTRASRRAPTTVLTTDTSNFRAMVQEFTGIPEPPFTPSSFSSAIAFPRSRIDVFRPFPPKLSPFSSSALTSTTTTTTTTTTSVLSDFLLPKQNLPTMNSNVVDLQISDHRNPRLQMGFLQDLSLSPGFINGNNVLSTSWGIGGGGGGAVSEQALFKSINGKYSSPSDFHGDKGSENVMNRSEGMNMIEPWICSSDH